MTAVDIGRIIDIGHVQITAPDERRFAVENLAAEDHFITGGGIAGRVLRGNILPTRPLVPEHRNPAALRQSDDAAVDQIIYALDIFGLQLPVAHGKDPPGLVQQLPLYDAVLFRDHELFVVDDVSLPERPNALLFGVTVTQRINILHIIGQLSRIELFFRIGLRLHASCQKAG